MLRALLKNATIAPDRLFVLKIIKTEKKILANHHHTILNHHLLTQDEKSRPTAVYMLLTGLPRGSNQEP